jgi:hypothetical protein
MRIRLTSLDRQHPFLGLATNVQTIPEFVQRAIVRQAVHDFERRLFTTPRTCSLYDDMSAGITAAATSIVYLRSDEAANRDHWSRLWDEWSQLWSDQLRLCECYRSCFLISASSSPD